MAGAKKNPHVVWIGIDPNLLLAGLDTKALFGCDNYLKFSLNPVAEQEDEEEEEDKVEPKLEDDVKEEVSSGEDDFDDSMQHQFSQEMEDDEGSESDNSDLKLKDSTDVKDEASGEGDDTPQSKPVKVKQRRDHSKKNPDLFCARCKKTFCFEKSFERHMEKNDCRERDENYVQPCHRPTLCAACGQTFRDRSGMKKHYKLVHMGQRDHKCDQCDNEYSSKIHLKRHFEAAHLDLSFHCEFCSKVFKTSVDLKEHEKREHSGVAIPCPHCNKNFIQQRNLDLHIENGICQAERVKYMNKMKKLKCRKEIPCTVCGKLLTSNYKMKRHMENVHIQGTGMSPKGKCIRCQHCEFNTPWEKKLERHLETMHPDEYNPYHTNQ